MKQLREMPSFPCRHRALGSILGAVLSLLSRGISWSPSYTRNPDAWVDIHMTRPAYIFFFQLISGMYLEIMEYNVFFRCCFLINGEETDTEGAQPDK